MTQPAQHHTCTEADPDADALAEQRAQNTQYYLRALHHLLDISTDIATLVQRQAHAQAAAQAEPPQPPDHPADSAAAAALSRFLSPPPLDPTMALERIGRTIRRTIILADKLNQPPEVRPAPKPPSGPDNRTTARKRIIRAVEDTIQRNVDGDAAERLHAELLDRLDEPDLEDDIATRPVEEIIRDICRDLGVAMEGSRPWKRRTPADIAVLAARAAMTPQADPIEALPETQSPPESDLNAPAHNSVVSMRPYRQPADAKTTDPP
jgi:hypothetical protein